VVQEKIGEGNLFTVYKCEDRINNRVVAAKVLLPQYASNRMFAERMLVEAQAMIGVAHPGIVEVYDCGDQDGEYYVIVEYVRGLDLKERIRRNAGSESARRSEVRERLQESIPCSDGLGWPESEQIARAQPRRIHR
jgi:serine/threonine-protein kinase